jgi:threonine dehydrogenase-like Zn-dependent dehydrogenase
MKALIYGGAGLKGIEDRPKPAIQAAGAAIVKIGKMTIRGTDLHILKGASRPAGRILRYEGVGIVDAVGTDVTASSTPSAWSPIASSSTAHSRRLRNPSAASPARGRSR